MHLDPHTLHALVEKVRSQLRCPQCTKKVEVTMPSLKVMGDSFAVFQLHCTTCEAHILLYATLRVVSPGSGAQQQNVPSPEQTMATTWNERRGNDARTLQKNFSTTLELEERDLQALRQALRETEGNFSEMFEESV